MGLVAHSKRRTRAEMDQLDQAVITTIEQLGPPVTLRQLFYAMLPLQLYAKTEQAYKDLRDDILTMKEGKMIPYGLFGDNILWRRKPTTYSGLEQMLEIAAQTYRRAVWTELDCYVEIWCEKDAMAHFLYTVTGLYDVPLNVTRGFPPATFAYDAAEAIKAIGKRTYIYYFGDYDPSGILIARDMERKLGGHGAAVRFERIAVNEPQITEWNLPTRPTKGSGSHAKRFQSDESVELDAVPPGKLRQLIEACIVGHLPEGKLESLQWIEEAERETLRAIIAVLQRSQTK